MQPDGATNDHTAAAAERRCVRQLNDSIGDLAILMFTRTVVGWVMLVAAVITASTLAYALGGGRIEATLGIVPASICVVGLLGGVVLLSVATSSTSNIAAIAWCVPGVAALVP